jgi:RNA polymerase sigma factor (sigma-70 family)
MRDFNDMALVREYVRVNSEAAFAELVDRHISLVYSAAFRHAGQAAHAQEITQAVFIILARKAAGLRPDTVLAGWLCETTRLTALSFMRGEHRRQRREQEAYMQSTLRESTDETVWNQLSPLLDEAMSRLGRKERDAVVLRYFKDQNLREVAELLNINEPAAQKRVNRALEKLRKFFTKRGVDSTTAIIAGAISANSVQAAPVGLAKTISVVAVAKGAAASVSTLTLIKGALKIMAWTKMKSAVAVVAGVLLAAGTTTAIVKKVRQQHLADALVFYNSAMKHYMANEYESELADLNRAIELNPRFAEALFSRGCLYGGDLPMNERNDAKAVSDYSRLLDLKPDDCSGRFNRALCYEALRKYDQAIADYTRIIDGNTDFSLISDGKDGQLARTYHYRGRAYQWYKKDYLKAIADYDEALRHDSKIEMVHLHRGQCYEALKQFDKAKEDFATEKAQQPK